MISWQYFPKNENAIQQLKDIIVCFEKNEDKITSEKHKLPSNRVLDILRSCLLEYGFSVEDKDKKQKIIVPVLYGRNGKADKTFNPDAYHPKLVIVIEIEAGRAITNNQILKDYFQACMMLDVKYLILAVRKNYRKNKDFEMTLAFFDALFASGRIQTDLTGILVIGY